jgi:2-polyprenyl-6-hydroxyphenyl methylase/3-demethylubiquinone-9 3-methyltransferase
MNSESSSLSAAAAYKDFGYRNAAASHMHRYLMPVLLSLGGERLRPGARILDVDRGNGFKAGQLLARGCEVVGIDPSESGIAIARENYPAGRFEQLSADRGFLEKLQCAPSDVVASTEVIEHLRAPRSFVAASFDALKRGGRYILSTPYHGYLKNLSIVLLGAFDTHVNPLFDGGHIKFWSRRTLSALLRESGFRNLQFRGAGRLPFLWKSMVMAGDRPSR